MFSILKDVRSGALPISEIPSFVLWAVGKSFWFWFAVVVLGCAVYLAN